MVRKPRADAVRNRERLLEVAKAAFEEVGSDISLEELARRAGVGIGTLYRHFPTRDAVVEAVYRREFEHLSDSAAHMLESMPPAEALHRWMLLFVDYITTKKIIAPALQSIAGGPSELYASSGARLTEAIHLLVAKAKDAGGIRSDVHPEDVIRALIGFTHTNPGPGWDASARRLVDILMNGLRTP